VWEVRLQVWFRDIDRPLAEYSWNENLHVAMVRVHEPNVSQNIGFALTHSLPLSLKLEAVVVAVIAKDDVLMPGKLVPDRTIFQVTCFAFKARFEGPERLVLHHWRKFPNLSIEFIWWKADINAHGVIP
jgi:hypothetical protein